MDIEFIAKTDEPLWKSVQMAHYYAQTIRSAYAGEKPGWFCIHYEQVKYPLLDSAAETVEHILRDTLG